MIVPEDFIREQQISPDHERYMYEPSSGLIRASSFGHSGTAQSDTLRPVPLWFAFLFALAFFLPD